MFRTATIEDEQSLRKLWEKCFSADKAFLDLYFGKGIKLCRTFVLDEDSTIVSALSVFPIKYARYNGGYVYGVCTHPAHRGHKYAETLLAAVENVLFKGEADFLILRPASPTLFGYYMRQGYDKVLFRQETHIKLPLLAGEISLQPLTGKRLFDLRQRLCNKGRLFECTQEMCEYILDYTQYCNGKACEINFGESYFISYPDPDNPSDIICEENGDFPNDSSSLLLYSLRAAYPNAESITIMQPSTKNEGQEHVLYKGRPGIITELALFSFAME